MNKKVVKAGVACGIFLGTTVVVYAITSLFFTKFAIDCLLSAVQRSH